MYNKTILIGNLTRDIELRYLPGGSALAKTAIATSYKYKSQTGEQNEEVCFLELTFFGRNGEIANQYLKKGSKILVEGRLVFEQWTAQDGSVRSRHSLRVEEMKMLDSKPKSSNSGYDNSYRSNSYGSSSSSTGEVSDQKQGSRHHSPQTSEQ